MVNRANAYAVDSHQELQDPSGLENVQTTDNRPTAATGKPIRVIIIAIIIILLIIIPLIVAVVLLSRQNSSSKNDATFSTTNGIPTMMTPSTTGSSITRSTTTSTTTTSAYLIPQCTQAQLINDTTRLVTASQGTACDTFLFDSTLRWVRFIPPGGTQIPTTPTNWNQCGAMATGWLNSSLPSSGLSVNATVCFTAFGNNCYWNNMIQITNCGGYYVYGLFAPPGCDARYCTV